MRVALAAGGTGGHVMPAVALAEALREEAPGIEVLFFSGRREQEVAWYRQAGADPVQLPAAPIGRGAAGKLRGLWGAWNSYWKARKALRRWGAQCVVGLGGYVSGPCVLAGKQLGLPTVIHEQNAIAGKANRWLARRVAVVATTFPQAFSSVHGVQAVETGNPIRERVLAKVPKKEALAHFRLDSQRLTLLASGGSQGAQRLNEALIRFLAYPPRGAASRVQIIWLAGTRNRDWVERQLQGIDAPSPLRLVPFLEEMSLAYAAADAILCRAGSASLAEAAAWGLPMIAVPFPWAADDHQRLNAEFFAKAGACVVLEERDLDARGLSAAIELILGDEERRRRMSQAALGLARPDAARNLARLTLEALRKARIHSARPCNST